jgi:hypothetical protein
MAKIFFKIFFTFSMWLTNVKNGPRIYEIRYFLMRGRDTKVRYGEAHGAEVDALPVGLGGGIYAFFCLNLVFIPGLGKLAP